MAFKYLSNGREVEVVRELDGGAIIQEHYEYEEYRGLDDEPEWQTVNGRPYYVEDSALFDKPPTEKLHSTIKSLSDDILEKRKTLRDLTADAANLDREVNKTRQLMADVSAKHDMLSALDTYFSGKVKYVVEFDVCGIPETVLTAGDKGSRSGYDIGEKKLRLLCFTGHVPYRSPDDAGWELGWYSDGSHDVPKQASIPCKDFTEATKHAANQCKYLASLPRNHSKSVPNHRLDKLADACDKFHVEKPAWLHEYVADERAKMKEEKARKTEDRVARLKAEIEQLEKQS